MRRSFYSIPGQSISLSLIFHSIWYWRKFQKMKSFERELLILQKPESHANSQSVWEEKTSQSQVELESQLYGKTPVLAWSRLHPWWLLHPKEEATWLWWCQRKVPGRNLVMTAFRSLEPRPSQRCPCLKASDPDREYPSVWAAFSSPEICGQNHRYHWMASSTVSFILYLCLSFTPSQGFFLA